MFQKLRSVRNGLRNEDGQVLILFAGGLVVFLAFVGLSVDIGRVMVTQGQLQRSADAAALAGGQDLPNTSAASLTAGNYITSNNGGLGGPAVASVTFAQTNFANDTIRVQASREVETWFLKVVGIESIGVSKSARVSTGRYNGGSGILPWGFIASNQDNSELLQNSCYLGQVNGVPTFRQNHPCTVKYGAGTNSGGDFGAVALDNTGASEYRDDIMHGSSQVFRVGDILNPQTGNMQGPTTQGLNDRLGRPAPAGCPGNGRNDVLITNPDGSVSIRPGCEGSGRIGILPVVNRIQNPGYSTILGFAFVFITGSNGGGGQTRVNVEFVKYVTELPGGQYNGIQANAATTIKLTQ